MKGDFTRDTFDPLKHFSRVLMQQGRVTLDADANEQAAILLRYTRKLARDLIGPYAAPVGPAGGFQLKLHPDGGFSLGQGCYYVDGILVENDADNCTYKNQPDYPVPADDPLLTTPATGTTVNTGANQAFWIYLDVWERHITRLEDDSIREPALGGPDTGTRAKVVWQVKAQVLTPQLQTEIRSLVQKISARLNDLYTKRIELQKQFQAATDPALQVNLFVQMQTMDEQLTRLTTSYRLLVHELVLRELMPLSNAALAARVDPGLNIEDACVTPPDSKYRGAENHLYRVEIHRGGKVGDNPQTPPTFKWSRDNGSVATAWLGVSGNELQVASVRGFAAGNWVELSDDNTELLGQPGVLLKLAKVEGDTLTVVPGATVPAWSAFATNPKVRRWDQIETEDPNIVLSNGAVKIQERTAQRELWVDLEDGVQIQFSPGGEYRTGDYWLIPARVTTGKVEWPQAADLNPQPLPPRGIEHHYALLGAVTWDKGVRSVQNDRCEFSPLSSCVTEEAPQVGRGDVVHRLFGIAQPGVGTTSPT